jgi:hypothetical protein
MAPDSENNHESEDTVAGEVMAQMQRMAQLLSSAWNRSQGSIPFHTAGE